jgi:hypothetical protein
MEGHLAHRRIRQLREDIVANFSSAGLNVLQCLFDIVSYKKKINELKGAVTADQIAKDRNP